MSLIPKTSLPCRSRTVVCRIPHLPHLVHVRGRHREFPPLGPSKHDPAKGLKPCFGGFCDWRLPTSLQIATLFDLGQATPTISPLFNSGCVPGRSCTRTSPPGLVLYWTSSTAAPGYEHFAWTAAFNGSQVNVDGKTTSHRVRAVRRGP